MKGRFFAALAIAIAATTFAGVGSASATTVFGSECAATGSVEGAIFVSTGHSPASPLPVTAPISGVITEWKVVSNQEAKVEKGFPGEYPRIFQPRLLVLQSEGSEKFKVVAEASGGSLDLKGANVYLSRLPIQAGDYLGLAGNPYALYCQTNVEGDTFGQSIGGTPVGSTFGVSVGRGIQVPVVARIEPDVDGDGYGDETQDKCPQSAAYQSPCPVVTVSSLSLTHPKVVTVYVSSSLSAPVTVTASVKIGKDKTVTLQSPGQTVAPGALGRFNLALTKPVLNTLAALTTKKSLTLTVSASAANVTGSPSTATSKLKLPWQRKPVPAKNTRHKKRHPKHAHRKSAKAKTTAPKHH
jgi:hypothetical protein